MRSLKSNWFSSWGIVTIVVGVILTIVSYKVVYEIQHQTHKTEFMRTVDNQLNALKNEVDTNLKTLFSIEGFYAGSNNVDRQEFKKFVKHLLDHNMSIQALEWIPRILHKDRADYENSATNDLGSFQITERIEGKMVRAKTRDKYFPVYFLEPLDGNEKALGFDLGSSETRLVALVQARDFGKTVATARIKLVQKNGDYGFLVFLPIYKKTSNNVIERQANLQGFALAVYDIKDMVEKSLSQINTGSINLEIHIYDVTNEKTILYPKIVSEDYEKQKKLVKEIELFYKTTIDVAGRKWKIELLPTKNHILNNHQKWDTMLAPLIVFLFTIMIFIVVKQRNSELMEKNQELRQFSHAIDQNSNGTIVTDLYGSIRYANPAFCAMTGYTKQKLIGKNSSILKSGKTQKEQYDSLWETINTGNIWKGEMENKKQDGSPYWVLITISPVKNEIGETTNFVSDQEDITDRKKAEKELMLAKEKAENANIAKSEFLANMSHEIRTPMNAIIGMNQLVLETELTPYQSKHLTTVKTSANGLLRILNDILDFSKIESGKMEIIPETFNLRKVLESALDPYFCITSSKRSKSDT